MKKIFFTQAKFQPKLVYPNKCINCDKSEFATKKLKIWLATSLSKIRLPHIHSGNNYVEVSHPGFIWNYKDKWSKSAWFSPTRPSGPSWSSIRKVCVSVCLSVCPLLMRFFCVVGLVWSVPRPWTGADQALASRGALKTGRCSKLDTTPPPHYGPYNSLTLWLNKNAANSQQPALSYMYDIRPKMVITVKNSQNS